MSTRCVLIFIICLTMQTVGHAEEISWKREVSVGYDRSSGNTESDQLSANALLNRNREHIDEITLKGNTYYSSFDKQMNAQKWYGMGRYAFSFGGNKKWYNFYRFEADHDRFANVDYRFVPAAGLGYWFSDLPELKLIAEAAIGWEYTEFKIGEGDSKEVILAPRGFLEKKIFDRLIVSEDFYAYPTVEDFSDYRLHSETAFTSPLTDKLSLRLSLINDYNSNPSVNVKKNDLQFISSLMYSF